MIGKKFSRKTIITAVAIFVTFVVIAALRLTNSPEYKKERISLQEAEKLYQQALSYNEKQSAPAVKYTMTADYCRKIIKHYPDTPQAEKAEQLLKQIPEKYTAQLAPLKLSTP